MNRLATIAALVMRDGAECYLCHQGSDPTDPWHVEHVKPRSAGGSDDLGNLALAHQSCNLTKGTKAVVR